MKTNGEVFIKTLKALLFNHFGSFSDCLTQINLFPESHSTSEVDHPLIHVEVLN